VKVLLALAGLCVVLTGCAVGSTGATCTPGDSFTTTPLTATADHLAAAPGNQQQFVSIIAPTDSPAGCPLPQWLLSAHPAWTSSDAIDIQISSANDATNGTAVCMGPTQGAATLKATYMFGSQTFTSTSTLTCK
jgi:hypothetical protein